MLVDSGRSDIISILTSQLAIDTYEYGLWMNNYSLVEADTFAALTECVVAGYFRQPGTGWGAPTGPVGGVWSSVAANITFLNTSGAPVNVYGLFVFGVARGIFYGGANFGGPVVLPAGGSLVFAPTWNDDTL